MRNQEVIRQWNILRTLDANRHGRTVKELSRECGVSTRTIWRDMVALQQAEFPLTSEADGRETRWKLMNAPFRGLSDLGISTTELCALYMSRTIVEAMADVPVGRALTAFCKKLEKSLPAALRTFLDRLPSLVESKPGMLKRRGSTEYEDHFVKLLTASHDRRVCQMRYFSASSAAVKDYTVHPYRLSFAAGGSYLLAFVPAYNEIRTFAIERIQTLRVLEEKFELQAELPPDAFAHSLGVNRGKPERVVVRFLPAVAAYVRERTWHASQHLEELADGGVRMTLDVCVDAPLRTWILGFGAFAKVDTPAWLAEDILAELDQAREAYVPRLEFVVPNRVFAINQPRLPGLRRRAS